MGFFQRGRGHRLDIDPRAAVGPGEIGAARRTRRILVEGYACLIWQGGQRCLDCVAVLSRVD